jgi:hypothetical protein
MHLFPKKVCRIYQETYQYINNLVGVREEYLCCVTLALPLIAYLRFGEPTQLSARN